MKVIYATNGGSILVDDVDYDYLSQWSWSVTNGHAMRSQYDATLKRSPTISMADVVAERAGIFHPDQLDHKNQNGLDNQRHNLRAATKSQNMMNRGLQSNNTSGYPGVDFNQAKQRWRGRVKKDGRVIWQGFFNSAEDAGRKVAEKRIQFFGEFANEQAHSRQV